MATADLSVALTDTYRQRVERIVTQVDTRALDLYRDVSWTDIRATYAPLADRLAPLIEAAQRATTRASAAYLTAYAGSELGKPQRPYDFDSSLFIGFSFAGVPIRDSLERPLQAILASIKADEPNPLGVGLRELRNAIDLNVKASGRQLLRELMEGDDRIIGWRRVVAGTCGACSGLSEESHLPPGTPLDVHPNCECVSEAVFENREGNIRQSAVDHFDALKPQEQDDAIGTTAALAVRKGYVRLDDLIERQSNEFGPGRGLGRAPQIVRQKALKDVLDRDQIAQLNKEVVRRRAAKKAAAKKKDNVERAKAQADEAARLKAEEEARAAEARAAEERAQAEFDRREAEIRHEEQQLKFQSQLNRERIRGAAPERQKAAKQKEAGRKAALNKKLNAAKKQLEEDRQAHVPLDKPALSPDEIQGDKLLAEFEGYSPAGQRGMLARLDAEQTRLLQNAKLRAVKAAKERRAGDSLLESGKVTDVEPLGGGVTSSMVGKLEDGTKVVLKRRENAEGLRNALNEEAGIFHSKAAARIGEYLDVRTPKFTVRDLGSMGDDAKQAFREMEGRGYMEPADELTPDMPVGIQEWTRGFKTWNDAYYDRVEITKEEAQRFQALDYVIGNTDRHGSNFGVDGDGRLVAIDHDLSFPTANYEVVSGNKTEWISSRTGVGLGGQKIPTDTLNKLKAMIGPDQRKWTLQLRNEDGLTRDEVDYMFDRIRDMVRTGRYPTIRARVTAEYSA